VPLPRPVAQKKKRLIDSNLANWHRFCFVRKRGLPPPRSGAAKRFRKRRFATMKFELPPLPYEKSALEPHISARTLEFHYEKHHRGYLNKLKAAIDGKPEAAQSLEDLIRKSTGGVFNNAAQVWNHTFYWQSMKPKGGGNPSGKLLSAIEQEFGSVESAKQKLAEVAGGQFGSGWAWLITDSEQRIRIVSTSNAENPLQRSGVTPLLTVDVWEHAYYLDYQNARDKYLSAFLDHVINWDFAADNYEKAAKV
jgi:Fe-Mn family superoxide dismutase